MFLTCATFITTPECAPRLRTHHKTGLELAAMKTGLELAEHAKEQGWNREVKRYISAANRVCPLLDDLGELGTENVFVGN